MATTKKTEQDTKETKKKTTATAKKTPAKSTAKVASTAKKTTAKAAAKKETTKKATTKATDKKASTKTTAKKTVTKKAVEEKKKVAQKKVTTEGFSVKGSNEVDDLLSVLSVTDAEAAPKETTKKASGKNTTSKTKETTKSSAKKPKPSEIKRPERKAKTFTKEEKVLYKRLDEAFSYVANLTMVMEERLLDKKQITDLTLGEIHVLEVVDREAVMPMTKIANELKITVGSLTTCVNRLVKKEYLYRERDQEDHRVMKISTTQKAKKVLKLHDRFHEDILYGILDGVTIRDATKVMTQIKRTLENYFDPKEKNYEKPIDKKKKKNI